MLTINTALPLFFFVSLLVDHQAGTRWNNTLEHEDRKKAIRFARAWVASETRWENIPEWTPERYCNPLVPRTHRSPITHATCHSSQTTFEEAIKNIFDPGDRTSVYNHIRSLRFNPASVRYCQVQTGDDHCGDRWIMLCTTEPQPTRQCIGIMVLNPDSSLFDH